MTDSPTVVLVHGAFADASGFAGVITELEAAGHTVVAPPNPLRSLAADAAAIHAVVASIEGPVVLVGHSYGGAVITQASATLSNVSALVYLAGFGIDEGESCASVQGPFPPSMLATNSVATSYQAPGRPTAQICTSLPTPSARSSARTRRLEKASVMRATQRPLSLAALTENATAAGWKTIPSWYLVSNQRQRDPARSRGVHGRADGRNDRARRRLSHSIHRAAIDRRRTHCEGGRRLTTANDREDRPARRRGLTEPRHPPRFCGVVSGVRRGPPRVAGRRRRPLSELDWSR